MPPGSILVLLLLALLLAGWLRGFSRLLLFIATISLYLLSTPWLEFELAKRLEIIPPLQNPVEQSDGERVAIVVLGGGRYSAAPEFGQDVVGQSTLERLRYAARLHRQTGFPLLVTGGVPLNEAVSEAQLMAESLRNDFLVEKVWLEEKSVNTWEHGQRVPPILKQKGVTTMILVTHASHMLRSLRVFRQSSVLGDIQIIPAPTAYTTTSVMDRGLGLWRPAAGALRGNVRFLHEWLGVLWYQLRYS